MSLTEMPAPLKSFLRATERHDSKALLSLFGPDAKLIDEGRERSGDELCEWNDTVYIGASVVVHPIHIEEQDGSTVLSVTLDGDYAAFGVTAPTQYDWHFKLAGDCIESLRMVETKLDVPAPIVAFIMAMNMFDSDAMYATFAENALVNDAQREHAGRDAIRRWFEKELISDHVTMYVTSIRAHEGGFALAAQVTGDYDKTGLPDPLELRFYFSISGDLISQLIIIPSKRS
ncbi:MAG TPA: nuclear transport factor 2 family protein [Vicinamibacterales bacterium]|nr:nuclear transport factor 2 family protein [Vicinamibacterales bacterium]